jgi:very-short-patch-repair endonuclease
MAVKGSFFPYHRRLIGRSRELRHHSTPAERKLWFEFLRELPEKFTRQKPLDQYVVDFYCARHRLVIEIDGDTHFTPEAERSDAARTVRLAALGIRVLRFTNVEVMQTFEAVCERVKTALVQT